MGQKDKTGLSLHSDWQAIAPHCGGDHAAAQQCGGDPQAFHTGLFEDKHTAQGETRCDKPPGDHLIQPLHSTYLTQG